LASEYVLGASPSVESLSAAVILQAARGIDMSMIDAVVEMQLFTIFVSVPNRDAVHCAAIDDVSA
jgi:hypothetical protein